LLNRSLDAQVQIPNADGMILTGTGLKIKANVSCCVVVVFSVDSKFQDNLDLKMVVLKLKMLQKLTNITLYISCCFELLLLKNIDRKFSPYFYE
jgi:hypothetical protein